MLLVPESIYQAAIQQFGEARVKMLVEIGELVVIRGEN